MYISGTEFITLGDLILLQVWAEGAVLGRAKTALKFKYEI